MAGQTPCFRGDCMIRIEAATRADIPVLCDLLALLFAQEHEFAPDREAQTRGLGAIIDDPTAGAIFLARQGSQGIGMVNLLYNISTALGARVAVLEDLVVSPEARGAGVGKALLAHAIDFARSAGCRRITLLTDHDNTRAQQLYAAHGFEVSRMIPMRRPID